MKIAVDAMGGDNAPLEIVKGAVLALKKYPCEIVLVGNKTKIENILSDELSGNVDKIKVKSTTEVINMDEHPIEAVRNKKDSSIVVAVRMLKDGECDAVISAGSTGAAVAAAQLILGRIHNVGRPAIATPIPTPCGTTLLLDSGSNVDSRPEHLVQSGILGSFYAEYVLGRKNPSVALLNIGEEESKGNEQVKAAYQLFKTSKTINFVGNAEGRDIPRGKFDVIVCDGFVGNVILKFGEGLAMTMLELLHEEISSGTDDSKQIEKLLAPIFKTILRRVDFSENGGAPLLGVNGCCVISHGSSNAKAICSAIGTTYNYVNSQVFERIKTSLACEVF